MVQFWDQPEKAEPAVLKARGASLLHMTIPDGRLKPCVWLRGLFQRADNYIPGEFAAS